MTGTFTNDPTTDIGFIRLLIGDTEQNEASFSDEGLQAFLTRTGSVKEAAAIAYETWARNQAKIAKVMEERDFRNEREAITALLEAANAIRNSNIGTTSGSPPRRIATSQNENDGGYYANVRPLGNINQDSLEE
jgi:hypothetical protein